RAAAGCRAARAPSPVWRQDAGVFGDARRARSRDARPGRGYAARAPRTRRRRALAFDAAVGGGLRSDPGVARGAPARARSLVYTRARRGRRRRAPGGALQTA